MGFFFTRHLTRITVLILICAGLVGAASAVVITESPSQVMRGEPITIDISGLSNSSVFSLLIEATLGITAGQDFQFETTDFAMPIALNNGQISATTTGAQKATFSAQKGDTEVLVTRSADANGVFSFSQAQSIPAGTFDFIRLEGTPLPDTTTITSSIQLRGTKSGPDASHITFTVNGIDNGKIQLSVYVDGTQALYQTVTIGEGITTVPTTVSPISNTVDLPSANATPVTVTTNATKTFFSVDRNVSLTVEGVDYAGLVLVNATDIPATWVLASDAYTIAPDSLTFSPAATIAFRIPKQADSGTNATYFIGGYQNSQWVAVPSTAQNMTITAALNSSGTYALMAYKVESNVTVSSTSPPATTMTPESTSVIVSVVQETSPTPTATKAPMDVLSVFGALAIGIGIAIRKKK